MKKLITLILAAALLLSAACGTAERSAETDASADKQTTAADAADQTMGPAAPESTTQAEETTAEPTQEPVNDPAANDWKDYPEDELYLPPQQEEKYNLAYLVCGGPDDRVGAAMLYGPSETHFSALEERAPNFERLYVLSEPVNGWILCSYYAEEADESYEVNGWIRSDQVFEVGHGWEEDPYNGELWMELFRRMGYIEPASYNGPTVLRTGPGSDYPIAADVSDRPEGEFYILVTDEWTPIENGWVKVTLKLTPENPYEEEFTTIGTGYVPVDELHSNMGIGDKPVLYLYPETDTDVDVTVTLAKGVYFSCTYPDYGSGWHVTAHPDGMLTDRASGREYAFLYWELMGSANYTFNEGFVVKGSDTAAFLEETLRQIGLSARERNEFIVYWLPRMQNNPYNLISFQTEAYTSLVRLDITPEPDSLLRVFMAYRALNAPVEVPAQQFEPFVRSGFTAVEWGGAQVR